MLIVIDSDMLRALLRALRSYITQSRLHDVTLATHLKRVMIEVTAFEMRYIILSTLPMTRTPRPHILYNALYWIYICKLYLTVCVLLSFVLQLSSSIC